MIQSIHFFFPLQVEDCFGLLLSTYGEVSITHSPQSMRSCQINVCSRISPFLRQWQAVIKHSSLSQETTRLNSSDILQKWFTCRPLLVFFVSFLFSEGLNIWWSCVKRTFSFNVTLTKHLYRLYNLYIGLIYINNKLKTLYINQIKAILRNLSVSRK